MEAIWGEKISFCFLSWGTKGLQTVDICFDEGMFKMMKTLAAQIWMFCCCFIAGKPKEECVAFISLRWIVNITSSAEQLCHSVFCFNFPSQTDVDDVYKCLEDQLLVIIRLSFLQAPDRLSKQCTHCRSQNVAVVAVWCLVQLRASSWS